jgi:hypothetical protein
MMMFDRTHWHESLTDERVVEAMRRSMLTLDDLGFCLNCGAEAHGVEPDARRTERESCGERQVYGAQELFMSI